jgi:hypothetical protein
MIGTTVLLVARFMAHATRGVNAMASGIPNYAFAAPGDTPVARDAVPTVAVYNDVDHEGTDVREGIPAAGLLPVVALSSARRASSRDRRHCAKPSAIPAPDDRRRASRTSPTRKRIRARPRTTARSCCVG